VGRAALNCKRSKRQFILDKIYKNLRGRERGGLEGTGKAWRS
jgi:hypothetical protein